MTPNKYQELARRTRCPQQPVIDRLDSGGCSNRETENKITLLHASVGMGAEAGEFLVEMQKWLWYGKTVDALFIAHLVEELGDVLWYVCEACDALGVELETVMKGNIAKLRARFPDKYTDALAAEEGRDRAAEARKIKEELETGARLAILDPGEVALQKVPTSYAGPQIGDKPCETCGAPADMIIHDFTHDLTMTFHHWFCKTHERLSMIVKPPKQEAKE